MHSTPLPSRVLAAAAAAALSFSLAACGTDGEQPSTSGSSDSSAAEKPEKAGEDKATGEEPSGQQGSGDGSGHNAGTVEITVKDGAVDPLGERIEAEVGSELVLSITADQPGSLHVHSTPEQEIHYGKGTTRAAVAIEQPGIIEVESHDLGGVILQIEAR